MSLRTLDKRLSILEDSGFDLMGDLLFEELEAALGDDGARWFEIWTKSVEERTPEESAFFEQALNNPAINQAARCFSIVYFAANLRDLTRINFVKNL